MPVARLNDVELHYEDRGEGKPLLLIAGIPAIADDWRALAEPLSQSRRVIATTTVAAGDRPSRRVRTARASSPATPWRCSTA